MKLEQLNHQYVVVEFNYGIYLIDTSRDEDEYHICRNYETTFNKLDSIQLKNVIACNGCENETIIAMEASVCNENGNYENCTIYVPTFWE